MRLPFLHPDASSYTIEEITDVGRKRLDNQDAVAHLKLPFGALAVVCDGMGGYQGGEVASRLGVETLLDYCQQRLERVAKNPTRHIRRGVQQANRAIWKHKQRNPQIKKMGTTLVAVLCVGHRAYVAHVGDSRLYLLRQGSLLRVTKDHSMIQRLIDEGKLTEAEAEAHPRANVISRVLGQYPEVEVDCQPPIDLLPGDRMLLCTDGLLRMIPESQTLRLLARYSDPEYACVRLINAANKAGGKDNTTVQIVDYHPPELPFNSPLWKPILPLLGLLLLLGVWGTIASRPSPTKTPSSHSNHTLKAPLPQRQPLPSPHNNPSPLPLPAKKARIPTPPKRDPFAGLIDELPPDRPPRPPSSRESR